MAKGKFNFANVLGWGRLLAAPVVVFFILKGDFTAAFWVFLIAGVTDAIDGPLARYLKTVNRAGFYLDPAADKLLINSAYVTLALLGLLPLWLAILVFLRDLLIALTFAFSPLMNIKLNVTPLALSKTNTGAQIALASMVLGQQAYQLPLETLILIVTGVVTLTTLASGWIYTVHWFKQGEEKGRA